jgi:hypothetical protein
MKKRKKLIVVIIILLVFSLVPLPISRNDGGTVEYNAILYKIIVWKQLNPKAVGDSNGKYIDNGEPEYLTGTDYYIFPFNFGVKEYVENLTK